MIHDECMVSYETCMLFILKQGYQININNSSILYSLSKITQQNIIKYLHNPYNNNQSQQLYSHHLIILFQELIQQGSKSIQAIKFQSYILLFTKDKQAATKDLHFSQRKYPSILLLILNKQRQLQNQTWSNICLFKISKLESQRKFQPSKNKCQAAKKVQKKVQNQYRNTQRKLYQNHKLNTLKLILYYIANLNKLEYSQSQKYIVCPTNNINNNLILYVSYIFLHNLTKEFEMRKDILNDEIVKMIEREQVISYKKKNQQKPNNKPPKQPQEDIQSAHSIKSNVFSDDTAKFHKKNIPLPELAKERRKMFVKIGGVQQKPIGSNYLEKEVRQHDNLVLKQQNNHLTTQNMKLKTKLMTLQKQNIRLQKLIEDDPNNAQQINLKNLPQSKQIRIFKNSQANSFKIIIKSLKKQLEDVKNQNSKIKLSVKFTRINEIQIEKQTILEETIRLRQMLEEQIGKRTNIKIKQHGISSLQNKISSLIDKNSLLCKENLQLQNKLKSYQQNNKKVQKITENQKNLNKMLFNARRLIKEKQKQIQSLKSMSNPSSNNNIPLSASQLRSKDDNHSEEEVKSMKINNIRQQKHPITKKISSKQKRALSKSAQKYRSSISKGTNQQCQQCKRWKEQITVLQRKIQELSKEKEKGKINEREMGEIRKCPIDKPTLSDIETVARFLTFRFKAHHLSFADAQKYLIHSQNTPITNQYISIAQIIESSIAEPFSILSSKYLQAFLTYLFYPNSKEDKITLEQQKKISKEQLLTNFKIFLKEYELMSQSKQEEMFIQIAQLVTNYHQHILTALNGKRNGQGTIAQKDLTEFFNEIQLQKQYVEFIITQIILESYDLSNLNYYAMFEIFYMPTPQIQNQPIQKKKFDVDHVVKEEDQQYQESRSYVDTKQKTISNKHDQSQSDHQSPKKKEDEGEYQQLFEEQKVQKIFEQEKIEDHKPYVVEEVDDYEEDYEGQEQ